MSQAQAERAVQLMYEDTSLREEITDDEANILLAWGEQKTVELSERGLDDAHFEALFGHLRELIAEINRFIGKRESMSPEAQRAALVEITRLARLLGYKVNDAEVQAYIARQTSLSPAEAVRALTEWIKPPALNLFDRLKKGLNRYVTPTKPQQPEE